MDFIFLAVLIGMLVQKKGFLRTRASIPIILFLVVGYFSLWNSSMRFSLPLPISYSSSSLYEYKNYAQMILLYFLVLNIIKEEDQQKTLIIIMSVVMMFIAIRVYRNFYAGEIFRWEKRVSGPFATRGLGPNEFAAFVAYSIALFVALFLFDTNKKRKLLFLITVLFSIHPLFFSFSRGAYVAAFAVLVFYGVFIKRSLLILAIIIVVFWQTLLPLSVVDRINMTVTESGEIEHSARGRTELWALAFNLFIKHPLFGVGFEGYSLSVGGTTTETGDVLYQKQDVHSIYMRILCEQGVIGFGLFLLILFMSFRSGLQLFKQSKEPFYKGLGLGFMGCVLSLAVSNLFGDRWSYYVLGGYFWVTWGLVDRCIYDITRLRKSSLPK